MARSRWHPGTVVASLALALTVTSCGATDEAPSDFCKSVDALAATVKQINQTSLTKSSVETVQKSVTAIGTTVTNLVNSAEAEFSDETDAVAAAAQQLKKTVSTAVKDPSSDTFYAARTAMGGLVTAVQELDKATSDSC